MPLNRKVHFHVFQMGNENINKHLGFVDILSSNSELVEELNQIKLALQSKFPEDKSAYQQGKGFFYKNIQKMIAEKYPSCAKISNSAHKLNQ